MFENFYHKYIELNLNDYSNIGFDFEINKVLFFVFLGLTIACAFTNYLQSTLALMIKKLLRTGALGEENAKTLSDLGLKDNRPVKYALTRGGGAAASIIAESGKSIPTYDEYLMAEGREREEKKKRRAEFFAKLKKNKKEAVDTDETVSLLANDDETVSLLANDGETLIESATDSENTVEKAAEQTPTRSTKELLSKSKPNFDVAKFYIPKDKEEYAKRYFNNKSSSIIKTLLSCILLFGFYIALVFLMPTILSAVNSILGG